MSRAENERELKNFCRNVAWLRKQNGLSKREMAKRLGIGIATLDKIERGEFPSRMGIEVLFSIQKHFGISPKHQLSQCIDGQPTQGAPTNEA